MSMPADTAYLPVSLSTPIAREAALLACRMLVGSGWYQRLYERGRMRDHDVLTLLGLEEHEDFSALPGPRDLREAVEHRLARLERQSPRGRDRLTRNIERLGTALRLRRTEQALLRVLVIAARVGYLNDFYRLTISHQRDFLHLIHHAIGCRPQDLAMVWRPCGALRRSGLLEERAVGVNIPTALDERMADLLLADEFDETRFLRHLVREAPPSRLAFGDFAHIADATLIRDYLGAALARRSRGVNVLIYGAPGTGKTEFARMLAGPLRANVYEVPNADGDGDPISGQRRFGAYAVCQSILAPRRRQILLFDEVEDVFGAEDGLGIAGLFGARMRNRDPDRLRKSWVNETLESNPVPAIWACNVIGAIDPAFLRRFDLVVEFRAPGTAVRRRIVDRYFAPGSLSEACMDRLARTQALAPAQVERAARVVTALRGHDQAARDVYAQRVVAASLRAMGARPCTSSVALPAHYDPAFLNADRDLQALAQGLGKGHGARLCLYGPPGTGKTAFAHHLGRVLERPVLVRRGSDLLDMFVGGTERLIREAFDAARDEGAILVIDEADGFLRDRSGARQSWEVSQVNELLTQMEGFEGLFIASTNLVDTLDAASLRRFDFKVGFDYLTRAQRRALLLRVVAEASETPEAQCPALAALDRLEHLAPGDFANVLRQLRVTGETPTAARVVALLASEASMKPEGRHRGIGF
ncbi:AAA family ATPase [Dokdonella sp.]|uniref:AAA family ATPase n=1 Tax=Dokdonella sp. TaxID=2291710 RepID=UPI0031C53B2A|nr:ATP-binding protein [Dokdonella sp.]